MSCNSASWTTTSAGSTLTIRCQNLTGNRVRLVGLPFCPDLLSFDDLGEADNLRGKLVRAFFKLLKWATGI